MQRQVYIVSQEGLDPDVNVAAVEAIQELMDCFPRFKGDYPVTNLGAWKDDEYCMENGNTRSLYAYKSTQWYMAMAQVKAREDGRYNQLNANEFFRLMLNDPTVKAIPQFQIFLTRDDLYAYYGGRPTNYCLGLSHPGMGSVISACRYLDRNGRFGRGVEGQIRREVFKTVVMHEFGHVIDLTYDGRKNTDENLGSHCTCDGCIMQQRPYGDYEGLMMERLRAKANGQPPICNDCLQAGNEFFHRNRGDNTQARRISGRDR